ncbi:MAG: hypothetical protein KGJ13_12540 [Patescibacteria group bacterium]|nr:hypothetical protein [Patescibacteria group bacterium]
MSKPVTTRLYLPTFAELTDRLTIIQLKAIFIPENKKAYDDEIALIEHDIDLLLKEKQYALSASDIRAIAVIAIVNRVIWENESNARAGGDRQDKMLKFTHSVNGVRNAAKNVLAQNLGERADLKIDCLAADLAPEFGNWQIWPKT